MLNLIELLLVEGVLKGVLFKIGYGVMDIKNGIRVKEMIFMVNEEFILICRNDFLFYLY